MKLRSTTPVSNISFAMRAGIVVAVVIMAVSLPLQFFAGKPVSADDYDAKIQALRSKVSGYQDEANALSKKTDTLQNALRKISNDKTKIQAEVDLYQVEHDKLSKEIKDTETRIAENRKTSGDLIVASSLSDDVPLIVRIAGSNNLADYIDGEVNRASVRDTIVQKTEENEKLKSQLQNKRAEVGKVLKDQKFKRNQLAAKEAEQQRLVAKTKNNEKAYRALVKKGKDQISGLLRQQQAEAQRALNNSGAGSSWAVSGTEYPWKNAPTNYNDSCISTTTGQSLADSWGYCLRQCTSYVAWKLAGDGKRGFSGMGHAYSWWHLNAVSNPRRGDVIVSPAGGWGHVMYIEGVSGGIISYSDYNGAGGPVSPGKGNLPVSLATDGMNYKVVRF